MATIELEEGLYHYLISQPNIAAYVAGRVYEMDLPQNPTWAAITFQRISTDPDYVQSGQSGYVTVQLQIDSWASTRKEARQLATQVRMSLSGYKGLFSSPDGDLTVESCFLLDDKPMPMEPTEEVTAKGRVVQEYKITFQEDIP